jgi:hypothetical protein
MSPAKERRVLRSDWGGRELPAMESYLVLQSEEIELLTIRTHHADLAGLNRSRAPHDKL